MIPKKISPRGMISKLEISTVCSMVCLAKAGKNTLNRGRLVKIYMPLIMPQICDKEPDVAIFVNIATTVPYLAEETASLAYSSYAALAGLIKDTFFCAGSG